jgi:hypothetical protein
VKTALNVSALIFVCSTGTPRLRAARSPVLMARAGKAKPALLHQVSDE